MLVNLRSGLSTIAQHQPTRNWMAWSLLACSSLIIVVAFAYAAHMHINRNIEAERAAFWKNVIDHTGRAVVVCDINGNIAEWNKGAEQLFGYTYAEVIDTPSARLVADPSVRGVHETGFAGEVAKRTLKEGQSVMLRGFAKTKDGKSIFVGVELTHIHDHYDYFMAVIVPASKEHELFGHNTPYPGQQPPPK